MSPGTEIHCTKISTVGVFRCCIQSVDIEADNDPGALVEPGDVIQCRYCPDGGMTLGTNGTWIAYRYPSNGERVEG